MPTMMKLLVHPKNGPKQKKDLPVATEKELLNFANRVREAGGANILDALLPSTPGDSHGCLIAQALNFDCYVEGWSPVDKRIQGQWADGSSKWIMSVQRGNLLESNELTKKLAKTLKLRAVRHDHKDEYALLLPRHIGNAAAAFDNGQAFQKYDVTAPVEVPA